MMAHTHIYTQEEAPYEAEMQPLHGVMAPEETNRCREARTDATYQNACHITI